MKVIEHLARATEPMISFEVIPPKRGGDISSLLEALYRNYKSCRRGCL